MYLTTVLGTAFGPLRNETLELATGLNVVHGPNEAGKSSWFNATYAGLAGRRKIKGRGTAAETDYKNRHKPWSGTKWAVGLTITMDDGRTLAIEQDLAKGEWTIVDGSTRQPILEADWLTDTTLDVTRLLGLNRNSARATIFTGQADILRVRDDAGELQGLLEKAASTEAADATADGASNWLTEKRREWVGVPHVGNKPLRASRAALEAAQQDALARRDDLGELIAAIGNRRKLAAVLQKTREDIELADRLLRWRDVRKLRDKVEKAVALSTTLAETSEANLVVDEDTVQAALKVLGSFENGTDVGPLPEGESAADLQSRIDTLPEAPEGDVEPRGEIQDAQSALLEARTALTTHMQTAPRDVEEPTPTALSADELRTLADVLASKAPAVDTAAVAEYQRTKSARNVQIEQFQREADENDVAYRQAKADYDAAVLSGSPSDELATLHNAERLRADELITAARRRADYLLEVISAQEDQAGVMAQEVALRQHQERVDAARDQVLAESLEPKPEALKQLARTIDEAHVARERARQHAEQASLFRSLRDDHTRTLVGLLAPSVPAEVSDEVVAQTLQAFDDYIAACKERAGVAQVAGQAAVLAEAHNQRQQLELSHKAALAARETQCGAVVEFARGLELQTETPAVAAEALRGWVGDQKAKRTALTERRRDDAVLEQLLDGRELTDLQVELAAEAERAGPEPDSPIPPDLEKFRADAEGRHNMAIDRDGQLKGQIQALGTELDSVAAAVEKEDDAKRAVTQVETLASCLDAAMNELERAKERANASIAPALAGRMRPWLPRVTNGRYRDVTVDSGNLTMLVTEATGQVRQADRLSLGTTEQIYLLLRMTLSQVLSSNTETTPLIFDDVTTQSDNTRTVAVMELLHELSTEHQIILFTQEEEVVTWAHQHVDPERDKIILLPAP